jgi:molecular chaperone DnaK (HSP70)
MSSYNEVIGIDFGMSNTSISYISEQGEIKLIPDELGNTIIPTVIENGNENEKAKFYRYFKRTIKDSDFSKELTIRFLRKIKYLSESHLNKKISYCVISVPVYWDILHKNQLKDCCEKAGLNVLSFIDEPVAGLLSYTSQFNSDSEFFLTIDCGGGTLDLSLVSFDQELNFYEVLTTLGDNNLGGEDLTVNLMKSVQSKLPFLSNYPENKLYSHIKKAKETLSYTMEYSIILEELDKLIRVSRNEFVFANKNWFDKFKNLMIQFKEQIKDLIENEIENENEIEIILIGGTTEIPYLITIVRDIFNESYFKLLTQQHNQYKSHKSSVAIGCSQLIKIICGNQNVSTTEITEEPSLLQKLNNSIGVEVEHGEMAVIISKDSYIPVSKCMFFTNSDEEETINIKLYSGERKYVRDNNFIGDITIQFLEKRKRASHKIKIELSIDNSNNLQVCVNTSDNTKFRTSVEFKNEESHGNKDVLQLFEEIVLDTEKEKE